MRKSRDAVGSPCWPTSGKCAAEPCGNCDNCLNPPHTEDGTVIAQKALSAAYRTGQRFGAMHLIDVLVGRMTERVTQFGHDKLSVFGVGRELNEKQWRAVLRQLVAMVIFAPTARHLATSKLTDSARGVLRGETEVMLREATAGTRNRAVRDKSRRGALAPASGGAGNPPIRPCTPRCGPGAPRWRGSAACRPTGRHRRGAPGDA